jgi:hypothetical protein
MPALSLALALALGQIPPPQLAQPGSTATLTAKAAELEGGTHRVRAQGDVVVKSGDIAVRADAMEYDTEAREGTASGSVVLADGNLVLVGREASFSLLGEARLTVRWAELFQKLPGERPPVEKVSDLQSAHSFGHNAFVIRAEELELLGPGHARARSMRISSCDCGEAAPAWSIGAKAADLIMGERALLTWAAFYVKGIPVLPLPVVYMPLSERRTGFLLPRPAWANVDSSGFSIDEPFFLTLGRSWDVTLEAGYRFGAEETAEKAANNTRVGTKGVRLAAELRYAPSEATAGRFKVMAVDDRHHDIANGMYLGPRGWRGELSARHSTLFGDAAFARADVNLVSDKNLLLDEPFDAVVGLSQTWTRSLGLAEVKARGALLGAPERSARARRSRCSGPAWRSSTPPSRGAWARWTWGSRRAWRAISPSRSSPGLRPRSSSRGPVCRRRRPSRGRPSRTGRFEQRSTAGCGRRPRLSRGRTPRWCRPPSCAPEAPPGPISGRSCRGSAAGPGGTPSRLGWRCAR